MNQALSLYPAFDLHGTRLAIRLLDEVAAGMKPVWPTTEIYAEHLVKGLKIVMERRGPEVIRLILIAPRNEQIDWKRLLLPLYT